MRDGMIGRILLLSGILAGCGVPHHKSLEPDGVTWKLRVGNASGCSDMGAERICVANLKPLAEAKAGEICQPHPANVSDCKKAGKGWIECGVVCESPAEGRPVK
jgi:hypothetical protein